MDIGGGGIGEVRVYKKLRYIYRYTDIEGVGG